MNLDYPDLDYQDFVSYLDLLLWSQLFSMKVYIYFSISLPSLKLTISLILITKHDAIDIADASSMQDQQYIIMNFIYGLADHRGPVAQW